MWSLCLHEDKETPVHCTLYFEVALHHVHLFHSATKPLVGRRIAFHCTAKRCNPLQRKDQAVGASLVGRRIAMQSKALQSTCKEKSRQWMHLWWGEELQCKAMQSSAMQQSCTFGGKKKATDAPQLPPSPLLSLSCLWWCDDAQKRYRLKSRKCAYLISSVLPNTPNICPCLQVQCWCYYRQTVYRE